MLEQLKNSKHLQKCIILQPPSQKHCKPILALPYNFNLQRNWRNIHWSWSKAGQRETQSIIDG